MRGEGERVREREGREKGREKDRGRSKKLNQSERQKREREGGEGEKILLVQLLLKQIKKLAHKHCKENITSGLDTLQSSNGFTKVIGLTHTEAVSLKHVLKQVGPVSCGGVAAEETGSKEGGVLSLLLLNQQYCFLKELHTLLLSMCSSLPTSFFCCSCCRSCFSSGRTSLSR